MTPEGTVFSSQDANPQDYSGHVLLYVLRSTNGGRTWSTIGIDWSREQRPCPDFAGCPTAFFGPRSIASDDNGRVYVLWNASPKEAGRSRPYLRWTDDNGETWSLPRNVDRKRVDHQFPMLAATGDGDVRIVGWIMGPGAGTPFTDARRMEERRGRRHGACRIGQRAAPSKSARGFRFAYGDYGVMAIGGRNGSTHVTWGESRSYILPGGSWYAPGPVTADLLGPGIRRLAPRLTRG